MPAFAPAEVEEIERSFARLALLPGVLGRLDQLVPGRRRQEKTGVAAVSVVYPLQRVNNLDEKATRFSDVWGGDQWCDEPIVAARLVTINSSGHRIETVSNYCERLATCQQLDDRKGVGAASWWRLKGPEQFAVVVKEHQQSLRRPPRVLPASWYD